MFAPRHAPYSNREVCHSLTWHSGKSESALERFEPIAVATLWLDGRGTLFALVAARRQKVFKRGIDTYAKHVCRRRRDGSQNFPLFVLFVLFGQAKRTLKEKKHKVTFYLSYFSVTKSYLRGVFPPCLGEPKPPFFILFVLFGHAKKHYKASFFSKIKISFPILQEINR